MHIAKCQYSIGWISLYCIITSSLNHLSIMKILSGGPFHFLCNMSSLHISRIWRIRVSAVVRRFKLPMHVLSYFTRMQTEYHNTTIVVMSNTANLLRYYLSCDICIAMNRNMYSSRTKRMYWCIFFRNIFARQKFESEYRPIEIMHNICHIVLYVVREYITVNMRRHQSHFNEKHILGKCGYIYAPNTITIRVCPLPYNVS